MLIRQLPVFSTPRKAAQQSKAKLRNGGALVKSEFPSSLYVRILPAGEMFDRLCTLVALLLRV